MILIGVQIVQYLVLQIDIAWIETINNLLQSQIDQNLVHHIDFKINLFATNKVSLHKIFKQFIRKHIQLVRWLNLIFKPL